MSDFEKNAMKGNELLNTLANKLGDGKDKRRAARVLRSVLHVLRDHLTVEGSMQLLSQLPLALKSVYVDGWEFTQSDKRIKNFDDFAIEVIKKEGSLAWHDFHNNEEVKNAIHAVMETLVLYISFEEMEQAFGTLPKELREILISWRNAVNDKEHYSYFTDSSDSSTSSKHFEFFY